MKTFLLFLDIDGVFNKECGCSVSRPLTTMSSKLNDVLVELSKEYKINFQIVWNTSHAVLHSNSAEGLLKILLIDKLLVFHKFCLYDDARWYTKISKHESRIDTIKEWFNEHPKYRKCKFLVIDDNDRKYQSECLFPVYLTFGNRGLCHTDISMIKNIILKWIDKDTPQLSKIQRQYHKKSLELLDKIGDEKAYPYVAKKTIHNLLLTQTNFNELQQKADVWDRLEELEYLFSR